MKNTPTGYRLQQFSTIQQDEDIRSEQYDDYISKRKGRAMTPNQLERALTTFFVNALDMKPVDAIDEAKKFVEQHWSAKPKTPEQNRELLPSVYAPMDSEG